MPEKSKFLSVRLTVEEREHLDRLAKESGMPGMEEPFARYMDDLSTLERCGIPREQLMVEKAELYRQLADVNREIRQARKEISLCEIIEKNRPQMERDIDIAEGRRRQRKLDKG